MGRHKKPTAMKLLDGNPGKRGIPDNEVKPNSKMPEPPSTLCERGILHWRKLGPQLHEMGLLTMVDCDSFAQYCQAYAEWAEATEFINEHGFTWETVTTYGKQVKEYPQVSISKSRGEIMYKLYSKFGLTPSDRAGLVTTEAVVDELTEFLNSKTG